MKKINLKYISNHHTALFLENEDNSYIGTIKPIRDNKFIVEFECIKYQSDIRKYIECLYNSLGSSVQTIYKKQISCVKNYTRSNLILSPCEWDGRRKEYITIIKLRKGKGGFFKDKRLNRILSRVPICYWHNESLSEPHGKHYYNIL